MLAWNYFAILLVTYPEVWIVEVGIPENTDIYSLFSVFLLFIHYSLDGNYSSSSLSDNSGERSNINWRGLGDVFVTNEVVEPRYNLCPKP